MPPRCNSTTRGGDALAIMELLFDPFNRPAGRLLEKIIGCVCTSRRTM
jgi:hypothetical protein